MDGSNRSSGQMKKSVSTGHTGGSQAKESITRKLKSWLNRLWTIVKSPFGEGTSSGWTAIFTGLLVFFTLLLVRVTDKVDQTTRMTQRAFITFRGIQPGGRVLSPDGKKYAAYQVFGLWLSE